jgi:bifunctional non-homologous end joining protein LigD
MLPGVPEVVLSHPDKVLIPDDDGGITKAALADHYARVADRLLPHVKDRPLSLQVFPGGIGRPGHFLKNVPDYFPAWVRRAELPKKGGTTVHPVADTADTLRMLVQHNAITVHAPTSRLDRPDRPDRFVVDFDPSGGDEDFPDVLLGARLARELLAGAGLEPFAMTTGSRGVHVVAPLRREADYGDVLHGLGQSLAAAIIEAEPERFTTEFHKDKREGRIFVDVLRNRPAQTAVVPYSVRAKAGAPVAVPVTWEELDGLRDARAWTVRTIPDRLERADPWKAFSSAAASPRSAARKLAKAAGTAG